jgi:prevent-host-death family protein
MMRHVPIAAVKDKLSEFVSAAEAGEEIVITRHGREVAKLTPADGAIIERRRAALAGMAALRERLRDEGVRIGREEIRDWIDEGRP